MLKTEINRYIENDQVIIEYDDGTKEKLLLSKPLKNVQVDAEQDDSTNSGYTFKK